MVGNGLFIPFLCNVNHHFTGGDAEPANDERTLGLKRAKVFPVYHQQRTPTSILWVPAPARPPLSSVHSWTYSY